MRAGPSTFWKRFGAITSAQPSYSHRQTRSMERCSNQAPSSVASAAMSPLFVGDAVDAWIKAHDRIQEVAGRIFNLGGGPANAVSLRELLDLITELRGSRPQCRFAQWRPGDQPWYVSDISAISRA